METKLLRVRRKCRQCLGKKYIEELAGLIQLVCPRCKGQGFVMKEISKSGDEIIAGSGRSNQGNKRSNPV